MTYFLSRKPTQDEYDQTPRHRCVNLTNELPEWDPSTDRFEKQEALMFNHKGQLMRKTNISALLAWPLETHDEYLGQALSNNRRISGTRVSATSTHKKRVQKGPATIAKHWGIGIARAQRVVTMTTQRAVRGPTGPWLSRRFDTNDRMVRYKRLSHAVYTDTMFSKTQSWHRKNRCAHVYATDFNWMRVFPMERKSQAHESLGLFAKRHGVPPHFVADGAKEQVRGEFKRKIRQLDSHLLQTEPYSQWQNSAEGGIRELKKGAGRKARKKRSPAKLWDHCLELEALIQSNVPTNAMRFGGQVPEAVMTQQPADISHIAMFEWYDWVYWLDTNAAFPEPKETLGRWLGPATDIGTRMTAKILHVTGHVHPTSTYRALTEEELISPEVIRAQAEYDAKIEQKIGESHQDDDDEKQEETPEYERYEDDHQVPIPMMPDVDEVTSHYDDTYVGAEVTLSHRGAETRGRVRRRAVDEEGNLFGHANDNPILDTRGYVVEFDDGEVSEYTANVIALNLFAQCDAAGQQHVLMDELCDHKTDGTEVKKEDQYVTLRGKKHRKITTKGWKLCVKWKDGSTTWERLADLKGAYPIEVAEYAIATGIATQPAFVWWVHKVLKKRDRIVAAVSKRYNKYNKRTHKFGFEVPKTVARAIEIDKENGNTLWQDAISKEVKNVQVAFGEIKPGESLIGYQRIDCHFIFDIKLDGFKRKARYVAGGHMTDAPPVLTYASVISRDTVRIALTMAALNDLDVKGGDVQNAYLIAPCDEKIWTTLGPEFGELANCRVKLVRAMYGLKSAGASFSRHLAKCIHALGYKSCRADPDLWYKPMVREDGFEYYAYVLLYVDDILVVHHEAMTEIKKIDKYFPMKPSSMGDPDIYLGAKLRKVRLDNGVIAWSISSSKYVQHAVANVEKHLSKSNRSLPKRARGPWPVGYDAEMDDTPELNADDATYYQTQIGVLRWCVELTRVDIITEVSVLASHLALPREGHLEAVHHIFAYLKAKHNARLVLDPTYPTIDLTNFRKEDWKDFYGDVEEPIPIDMPTPCGKGVDIRLYVDADLAGDTRTRRSRTGYLVFLNSALIMWLSKKQATIETSVFGSEFVAMKQGVEACRGLRYKLRMMGVPVDGPNYVYGDNMSVIHNTSSPSSTLKKKSNQICYHAVRESVAMGESRTGHVDSKNNLADIATKLVPAGQLREHLVSRILHDIFDG